MEAVGCIAAWRWPSRAEKERRHLSLSIIRTGNTILFLQLYRYRDADSITISIAQIRKTISNNPKILDRTLIFHLHHNIKHLIVGISCGIVFVNRLMSRFRIQEMVRLQSFHMYGIIGSAIMVGMISIFLIKNFNIKTIYGEKIEFHDETFNKGQVYGGLIFGLGWAITGACLGPLFAQIGTGATVIAVTL